MQSKTMHEMLKRFASAVTIASIVIFLGAIFLLLNPYFSVDGRYTLTTIWCIVPFVWGVWAVLVPKKWLPEQLPVWGAILGLIAGVMAIFVLDLPKQVFEEPLSNPGKGGLVLFAVVLYYVLWILVRWMYTSISRIQ